MDNIDYNVDFSTVKCTRRTVKQPCQCLSLMESTESSRCVVFNVSLHVIVSLLENTDVQLGLGHYLSHVIRQSHVPTPALHWLDPKVYGGEGNKWSWLWSPRHQYQACFDGRIILDCSVDVATSNLSNFSEATSILRFCVFKTSVTALVDGSPEHTVNIFIYLRVAQASTYLLVSQLW